MKLNAKNQRFEFKLELGDWKNSDTPEILITIAKERYQEETPILYKFTLLNRKLKVQFYQTMVAHFLSTKEVVILWEDTPIRVIEGFRNVEEAISKFLKSQDSWLQGRFSLSAEHWVWKHKAVELMVAANVLHEKAVVAEQRSLELFRVNYNSKQTSGSRDMTAEETSLIYYTGVQRQALMLLGFAIENAAKGILSYKKGGTKINAKIGDLRLADELESHKLLKMVKNCDEVITKEETQVLTKLTEWVRWLGRYPVPITHFEYDFSYQQHQSSKQTYSLGKAILQRLIDRLSAISK